MTGLKTSPSEDLMLEVLAARVRTGETCWTFESRHRRTADKLLTKGLVSWKHGIVENTIIVWLTDKGRQHMELDTNGYVIPLLREAKKAYVDYTTCAELVTHDPSELNLKLAQNARENLLGILSGKI